MKQKILFVCVHNSARSQIAEGLFREMCGAYFEVHSAGIEPKDINRIAIEVMSEVGIDIFQQCSKSVFDYFRSKTKFAYVVTMCGEGVAERCPNFGRDAKHLHWSFPDPALATTRSEQIQQMRDIRDAIKLLLAYWCVEVCMNEAV